MREDGELGLTRRPHHFKSANAASHVIKLLIQLPQA
jgi:hypothetical protein